MGRVAVSYVSDKPVKAMNINGVDYAPTKEQPYKNKTAYSWDINIPEDEIEQITEILQ